MNEEPREQDEGRPVEELSQLPRERRPPARLEERTVRTLSEQGLLHRKRTSVLPAVAIAAAIAVVFFGAGIWTDRSWLGPGPAPPPVEEELPQYLVLLHETESTRNPGVPEEVLIREYGAWAGERAESGDLVDGNKLAESVRWMVPGTRQGAYAVEAELDPHGIGGYFIIRAADYDEAVEIASSCPHLSYGGRIEIRLLETG